MLYNICDYIDPYKFSIYIYSWKASPAQSAAQTAGQDTHTGGSSWAFCSAVNTQVKNILVTQNILAS